MGGLGQDIISGRQIDQLSPGQFPFRHSHFMQPTTGYAVDSEYGLVKPTAVIDRQEQWPGLERDLGRFEAVRLERNHYGFRG